MAINYAKVGWDTTKYVNPTNMNHMDEGIKAACDKADANEKAIENVNNNLATVENTKLLSNVSVLSITKNGRYYIAGALDLPIYVNVFGYLDVHNYDDSGVNRKITWTPINSNITYINIKNDTWLGWDSYVTTSIFSKIKTLNDIEISCVEYFINNVYHNIAIDTDNLVSGIFVNNQYIAYTGIKPDVNFSAFVIFGYGIRAIHISNSSGNWFSSVLNNNYV